MLILRTEKNDNDYIFSVRKINNNLLSDPQVFYYTIVFKKGLEIEGNGGMVKGMDERPEFRCSKCLEENGGRISSQRTEIFTRVVGYLRPIQAFNKGKIEEFKMRTNYKMGGTALDPDGHAADHENVANHGAGCMERPRL